MSHQPLCLVWCLRIWQTWQILLYLTSMANQTLWLEPSKSCLELKFHICFLIKYIISSAYLEVAECSWYFVHKGAIWYTCQYSAWTVIWLSKASGVAKIKPPQRTAVPLLPTRGWLRKWVNINSLPCYNGRLHSTKKHGYRLTTHNNSEECEFLVYCSLFLPFLFTYPHSCH